MTPLDDRDIHGRPRRRPGLIAGIVLVAFLLGMGATALAVRRWNRVAMLLHPVAAASPVVVVRRIPVAVPPPPPGIAAVSARLDTIEQRITAIDARTSEAQGDADRAEGLLVAFAARRALDRGRPLGFLENTLRNRFGRSDAAAVSLVIAAAQHPVTLAQLQDGLATLAPTLATAQAHPGFWAATRAELGAIFVLHRADEPSTQPADRLARASHALEQGQVDIAAIEIARTPGAARAAAWLAAAHRYLLARAALERLETTALLSPLKAAAPAIDGGA